MSRYKRSVINAGKNDQTALLLKKRSRPVPAWRISLETRYARAHKKAEPEHEG